MRRAIAHWRILFVVASLAALAVGASAGAGFQAFAARSAPSASSKHPWQPMNHLGEQAYWAAREGTITAAQRAQWMAQIAKMPHANSLPPVVGAGAGPVGYVAGGPSGPWHTMGPSPIDANSFYGKPNYAGRVQAIAVDQTNSNIIYLGAAEGGVWKTTNGGTNWTPLTDQQASMATGAIAIDPNNDNIIYVGTGEPNQSADSYFGSGILKSTDGGAHWTQEGLAFFGTRNTAVTKIIVNPRNSNQIFVGFTGLGTGGLAVSTDGGVTYGAVGGTFPQGSPVDDMGINPTPNPVTLFATVRNSGFWRSTDGGSTWQQQTTGLSPANGWNRSALAVAPSNPSVLYVVVIDNGNTGNVWVSGTYNGGFYSTNGGTNWNPMASLNQNFTDGGAGPQGWYDLYLGVDPANDQTVYGGGVDVGVTTNARGASGNWHNITSVYGSDNSGIHPDQHAIAFAHCTTAPCPAWFGNDGGVYFSSNTTASNPATVTYSDLNTTGLGISTFTGGDVGPNYVNGHLAIGGTQDDGTMVYTGNTVQPMTWGGDGGFAVIDNLHPGTMYTENFGVSLEKSTDSGQIWSDGTGGGTLTGSSQFYMPYVMDRTHDQHLIAGTNHVYETINGTSSWYASSQAFTSTVTAVGVAGASGQFIYAATGDGHLWVDNHGGSGSAHTFANLDPSATLGAHFVTSFAADPNDATGNTVFVTTGTFFGDAGHIWKSTNALGGTATWTDISGSLPTFPINSAVIYYSGSTRVIVIGTDLGVFYTSNDGGTWFALNNGLPNAPVTQLALDSAHTTIVAFTHGRGEWSLNIPETSGGTGDTPGIFRPSVNTFFLRNSLTTGFADETVVFGSSTDDPIVGDWNGDGIDTVGIYRPSTATFFLKDSNAPGAPITHIFTFGLPGDIPIVGDWTGSGHDGVGVFRPSNGIIYLTENLATGFATYSMVFGVPGDVPVAGDWSGQGHDSVGIYRPSIHQFFLTNTNCNCIPTVNYVVTFGVAGDVPFTGDWTHSGHTGLGVFRTSNGLIYMRNDATTTGFADFSLVFGIANDQPVAGHFNTAEPTVPNPISRGPGAVNLPRQRAG